MVGEFPGAILCQFVMRPDATRISHGTIHPVKTSHEITGPVAKLSRTGQMPIGRSRNLAIEITGYAGPVRSPMEDSGPTPEPPRRVAGTRVYRYHTSCGSFTKTVRFGSIRAHFLQTGGL